MGNGALKRSRTVYLEVDGSVVKVVFSPHCGSRDIHDLLTAAVGVSRWSDIVLKNQQGALVSIAPTMPSNTRRTPYKVVVTQVRSGEVRDEVLQGVLSHVSEKVTRAFRIFEMKDEMLSRLTAMQKKIEMDRKKAIEIEKCKMDIREIKDELIAAKNHHANFCKCTIPPAMGTETRIVPKRDFPKYPKYILSYETKEYLKKPTFDIWHWESNEMLCLLEHMYHELGLVSEFNMNPIVLRRFLCCVQENYRNNPFHNFRHCFCVTQMMYGMIYLCDLKSKFSLADLGILLTAAVCHDLDHPGFNNAYQINARTDLAIRYNDILPLENHHCAVAFKILSIPECNIFRNVSEEQFKSIRQGIIMLIMATDMARHSEILDQFKAQVEGGFDFGNQEHQNYLRMVLIKCCDISNEVRPSDVSEPWVDCLLEEYFMQSDREKLEGLPVAPFMDREQVTKPTAQVVFIKYVLIPMFEVVSKLYHQLDDSMVEPLRRALYRYEEQKVKEDQFKERMRENARIRAEQEETDNAL